MDRGIDERHLDALADWLACAIAGARERGPRAARAAATTEVLEDRDGSGRQDLPGVGGGGVVGTAVWLGACGHVLDFDDTYEPGLAHLSAPVAPAAIALGAVLDRTAGDVLDAYARGFEAMGSLTAACHPYLYEGGWHPTAVCGGAGAAVAASVLLGLDAEGAETACALAIARAGGLRASFGTDGKALGVGSAAGEGVRAALFAKAGADIDAARAGEAGDGFAGGFGVPAEAIRAWRVGIGSVIDPAAPPPAAAVTLNWIKAYPCCLQTHGAIDACLAAVAGNPRPSAVTVLVNPISLRAASLNDVARQVRTGLEAKFSIAYTSAYALLRGAPTSEAFEGLDPEVHHYAAAAVEVRAEPALPAAGAVVLTDQGELARTTDPVGSPGNPMSADRLEQKATELAGISTRRLLLDPTASALALIEPIKQA